MLRLRFDEHSLGTQIIFTTEPIGRCLSKYLFLRPLCHSVSNCVPSKSPTKPLAVSMNEHGSKPPAIVPSRQNKHPGPQSSAAGRMSRHTVLRGILSGAAAPGHTPHPQSLHTPSPRGSSCTLNGHYKAAELFCRTYPNPSDLY